MSGHDQHHRSVADAVMTPRPAPMRGEGLEPSDGISVDPAIRAAADRVASRNGWRQIGIIAAVRLNGQGEKVFAQDALESFLHRFDPGRHYPDGRFVFYHEPKPAGSLLNEQPTPPAGVRALAPGEAEIERIIGEYQTMEAEPREDEDGPRLVHILVALCVAAWLIALGVFFVVLLIVIVWVG